MSSVDTRNLARDSLFLFAELALENRPDPVRVKVRNLSDGGMMAEADLDVVRGDRLSVDLRNVGKVNGSVAWVQGNRFGVAFEAPINAKLVRAPASAAPASEAPRYTKVHQDAEIYRSKERGLRSI